MKSRGLIFNGAMIRAILYGRKAVTRRCDMSWLKYKKNDEIWVKETWQAYEPHEMKFGGNSPFANCMMRVYAYPPIEGESIIKYRADNEGGSWRASIHMPRWASRLTLVLTEDAREERLWDITQTEAMLEGMPGVGDDNCIDFSASGIKRVQWFDDLGRKCTDFKYRAEFIELWDSLYPGSWERNDWVWRFELERVG
jgi:hypothetical protein